MINVGFVGWRGMVGSVLMERMIAEGDFKGFEPVFFTTSNVGGAGPSIGLAIPPLADARDLAALSAMDIIVTCQGGDYTNDVYPKLRGQGFKGYWIDAASALRMKDDSIIVLGPCQPEGHQKRPSERASRTYIGGNCTVSLMLMALSGLFQARLVEWISTMTYQAASGAGAKNMIELVRQMAHLSGAARPLLDNPAASALEYDALITGELRCRKNARREFRRAACGKPYPVDRQAHGKRPDQRGMERVRRDQQDPRHKKDHSGRRHLRARKRDALPQPGADHQTEKRRSA